MLTKIEIAALKGIQVRDREVQEKFIKPIQQDLNEIMVEIQNRLQITNPEFEFGKTYALDFNNLCVVPMPSSSDG